LNLEEVLLNLTSLQKYTNISDRQLVKSFPGEFLKNFEVHTDSVTQVRFHPQGALIVSGSDDCTIKIHDSVTKNCHSILKGSLSPISSIDLTNTHIISTSDEYVTRLWNISKSKLVHTFYEHRNIVRSCVFMNSQKFFSSSFDKMIKLWDIDHVKSINTFGIEEPIFQVSTNTSMLACFSFRTVFIWNVNNLRTGKSAKIELKKDISSIDLSKNDQYLLVNYRDSTLDLIDLRKYKLIKTFQNIEYLNNQDFNHAVFSHDSRFISVGSDTGCVLVWKISNHSNDPKAILRNSTNKPILSVDWNQDSSELIFGSKDKTISLFGSSLK
jgi:WD40 repeat protein